MALRSLSLCAGVAGIDLGLRLADPGIRTVCYVEWSHFPAAVIAARIEDGSLDNAPIWDDVGTFDGRPWRGAVDLITAGFPCQPVSLAGKRLGMADERFIWGDVVRIVREIRPRYVFLENVPGIVTADGGAVLRRVIGDLAALRLDAEWDVFSASETTAPHRRDRWFCLAYAPLRGLGAGGFPPGGNRQSDGGDGPLADAGHGLVPQSWRRSQGRNGPRSAGAIRVYPPARNDHAGWSAIEASLEPAVCRDADGLAAGLDPALFAYRNDRLRAVGNGVVPLTAAIAWCELMERMGGDR